MDPNALGELLLAFHILDLNGQNGGIAGHLTARRPGDESFWCHTYGHGFDEVRDTDLHHADLDLNILAGGGPISPSLVIHTEIYRARPDVLCVLHTHSLNAIALSATGAELAPLHQSALMLHGACALHADYDGIAETRDTGIRLARALGTGRALLLANHGTLVVGRSIREAVHIAIVLDQACRVQLDAMAAAGGTEKLLRVPDAIARDASRFLLSDRVLALRWEYYKRQALREKPWLAAALERLAGVRADRMAAQ